MVALITGPEYLREIKEAIKQKKLNTIYEKIDRDIDINSEIKKIINMRFQYFILDISCVEDSRIVPDILKRIKEERGDIRIILIAPRSFKNKEVINNLISIGIYDIIGQRQEEYKTILPSLLEHLESSSTYAKAVQWNDGVEVNRNDANEWYENKRKEKQQTTTIKRDKIIGTMIISVAGAMPRIGTTHTSISIAKYLMDNRHGVAVVEMHDSNNFNAIKNSYENVVDKGKMFSLGGIDFYPYDPYTTLADFAMSDYRYVVLDMGLYTDCNVNEFKRAHERVIVSGVKDWELEFLEDVLVDEAAYKYKYYYTFADKDMFEFVNSSMDNIPCYMAPFNPQPMNESYDCSLVYKEMLRAVLPQTQEDEKEESGILKSVLKKKEVTLYHKPILMEKLTIAEEERRKKMNNNRSADRPNGIIKLIIAIIILASILTGGYYVVSTGILYKYLL